MRASASASSAARPPGFFATWSAVTILPPGFLLQDGEGGGGDLFGEDNLHGYVMSMVPCWRARWRPGTGGTTPRGGVA